MTTKMKTRRRNTKHKVKRSRRTKKGGFGGWNRITTVGPTWNGQNGSNHFKLSPNGVVVGGVQPAVPEMWGPGINQANQLVPSSLNQTALSLSGGYKRNKRGRSKCGGVDFGGFPNTIKTMFDNTKIAVQNGYRGFMGLGQHEPASPWVQPALHSSNAPTAQVPKPHIIKLIASENKM